LSDDHIVTAMNLNYLYEQRCEGINSRKTCYDHFLAVCAVEPVAGIVNQ